MDLWRNPRSRAALVVTFLIAAAAAFAPWLAPYNPDVADVAARLAPIGTPGHVLGLDDQGRDVLSRMIFGARYAILAALVPSVVATVIGAVVGMAAAMSSKLVGTVILRGTEILFAFPGVILAIALTAILGPGFLNALTALTIVRVPYLTRVVYTSAREEMAKDYITAAGVLGSSRWEIAIRELLPNVLPSAIVYAASLAGVGVVTIAGLSFIGLGVQAPSADWGRMASDGRYVLMQGNPMLTLLPGFAIAVLALTFSAIGDGLHKAFDPKRRGANQ